jgi:DNA-binding SARP family transcriptional activator
MCEPHTTTRVHLIDGPYVCYGTERRPVPEGSKKLLSFVALRMGRIERSYAAGVLWPFGEDGRAAGNLRSALWRLRRAGIEVVEGDKWSLQLAREVDVDVHVLAAWANRIIHSCAEPEDLTARIVPTTACHLLPGWYDEWAVLERERIRQQVLHALEALSAQLSQSGRHAEAIEAALGAVREEPLRESGQRALISAYLAQGDSAAAGRAYARFTRLLRKELGVEPSRQLSTLLLRRQVAIRTERRAVGLN